MKNTKNPILKLLNQHLPLVCCIAALAGFLFLPFSLINYGQSLKYSTFGIEFLLNIGKYVSLPGYAGNLGGTLCLILMGCILFFVLTSLLAIYGCISDKRKPFNWGVGLSVIALTAIFLVLLAFPYYVPNSLGRKAFLFTEIGRTFAGLGIGYWIALVALVASVLIVEKRDRK